MTQPANEKGIDELPYRRKVVFDTEEDARDAGVCSGTLNNGDTFGDEDDGPEGGHSVFESVANARTRALEIIRNATGSLRGSAALLEELEDAGAIAKDKDVYSGSIDISAGFSCNGVNLAGSKESIEAVQEWHRSHCIVPQLKDRIKDAEQQNARLTAALAEERAKGERLAKALKSYGSHAASCQINNKWHRHKGCDCGLARALEQSR